MRRSLLPALLLVTGCSLMFDPDRIRLSSEAGAPDGGACTTACVLPVPTCSGSTLLVPSDPFCRDDGRCAWSTSETPCPQGCADGACIGEPCLGVRCDSPPANACSDGAHLQTFAAQGTCTDGTCAYAVTTTTCSGGCANGRCVDDDCAGVTCQSPPPASCSGNTLRTWAGNGTCKNGECTYAPTDTSCPAGCANGACLQDLCAGKTCTSPPAASCVDGTTLRTYASPGTCDPGTGHCSYTATTRTCTGGQVCSGGACMTPAPSCGASSCTGCCDGSTCVAIPSENPQRCGKSGQVCGGCGTGYACNNGSCVDVDECATNNGGCSTHASCTNTPGGRTCTCLYGFAGDGVTCTDVRGRISAGRLHSCAVGADGKVRCWGGNFYGQLCDASTYANEIVSPIVATELGTGLVRVSTGDDFTCAANASGAVKCCGYNDRGQLGSSPSSFSRTAVTAVSSGIVALAAGGKHVCGLTSGGGVKCWGEDSYGQLGNSAPSSSLPATAVTGLSSGVVAVAAGSFHSCALLANGTVKCWGWNTDGQLGDGTTDDQDAPVLVTGLSGVTVVGIDAWQRNTCALTSTGRVYCWGDNSSGQLGSLSPAYSATPVLVSGVADARSVAVGGSVLADAYWDFACVASSSGGYSCWGNNELGQLGDGTRTSHASPAPVTNLAAPIAVLDCGDEHCCAMTVAGERWCWGGNSEGELGYGSQVSSNVPVKVIPF